MPAPRTEKEVRGFLGRLNYITRFISHLTTTCEPIFKLLKKDQVVKWNDEYQAAFNKIKEYLQEPPVLIPLVEGIPLIMYLTVLENSMGCVLGQHDESGRKEHAIYYCCTPKFSLSYFSTHGKWGPQIAQGSSKVDQTNSLLRHSSVQSSSTFGSRKAR